MCSLWLLHTSAQIIITNTNLPNSGDTIRYSIAALSSVGDYTSTGVNYIWKFDTLRPIRQGRRDFTNNTPYLMFFGPLKFGEKIADTIVSQNIPGFGNVTITDFYQFYRNLPSVFDVEGAGLKINNIPVPSFYSDKDELYLLPLSYGQKDSTTFKFSTATSTAIPIVYKKTGYRITKVDGWGTISTPYGTFNCLRVVTTQYSKDTIIFNSSFGPIPIGYNNYQRAYQWLSPSEKIPILEVNGNIDNTGKFLPTLVRYRDSYKVVGINKIKNSSNNRLSAFPNPSTGLFKIENIFNTNNIRICIYNASGQNVLTINESIDFTDEIEIDASSLPNGNYTCIIYADNSPYFVNINIIK